MELVESSLDLFWFCWLWIQSCVAESNPLGVLIVILVGFNMIAWYRSYHQATNSTQWTVATGGMAATVQARSDYVASMLPEQAAIQPEYRIKIGDMKVPELTETNFKFWFGCLEGALTMNRCVEAVRCPLSADDPRNQVAKSKILESVKRAYQYHVVTAGSAFEAVEYLRTKLDCNEEAKCRQIEGQIRSMKLDRYDQVEKHLDELELKIQDILQLGGKMSEKSQIHFLVGTLIGDLAHLRDILLTYNSIDEAKGHLRHSASELRRIDDGPKDNVYLVKKKVGFY